jgi:hypothetical protein
VRGVPGEGMLALTIGEPVPCVRLIRDELVPHEAVQARFWVIPLGRCLDGRWVFAHGVTS